VPIQVHGDASFSGQGIVFETLQMQSLENYTCGGTVHIIVNNQIGFTTSPEKGRSGTYCSDVAKSIDAPIFHVNADSIEDVAHTFAIAAEYRQKFGKDVVIDLIGYRKMGHNEMDNPSFTHPLMYKLIKNIVPVKEQYKKQLIDMGIDTAKLAKIEKDTEDKLEAAYTKSKGLRYAMEDWKNEEWESIKKPKAGQNKTGVDKTHLQSIGEKISALPSDEKFHPSVKKIFDARAKSIS
jgi:2-oxoglutarate dehydrogenase E1 component